MDLPKPSYHKMGRLLLCLWLCAAVGGLPLKGSVCDSSLFECPLGSKNRCIEKFWLCEGHRDCSDGSDESPELCHGSYHQDSSCHAPEFRCISDHRCLPPSTRCDGEVDCLDGSDERDCPKEEHLCHKEDFVCQSSSQCLPLPFVCDGHDNCGDGSDEDHCECTASSPFLCDDGETCPPLRHLCDGLLHCRDRSDEAGRCVEGSDCTLECGHGDCRMTPHGPRCLCEAGYREQGFTCVDEDECEDVLACDQHCHNLPGGHQCTCDGDYGLAEDGFTCAVAGTEDALLYYAYQFDVKVLNLETLQTSTVYQGSVEVLAVAFDPITKKVYWSDRGRAVRRNSVASGAVDTLLSRDVGKIYSIALDWKGRNMYLADRDNKKVLVCNVDNIYCKALPIPSVTPTTIVLDLQYRKMYVSDTEAHVIYSCDMDGDDLKELVKTGLKWPNAMALDAAARKLYWIDSDTKMFELYHLTLKARKFINEVSVDHPYSMAIWEAKIYFSDWSKKTISAVSKHNGSSAAAVLSGVEFHGVALQHSQLLKDQGEEDNPCARARCSHLCLLKPAPENFVCACPSELTIRADDRTCYDSKDRAFLLVSSGNEFYKVATVKYSEPVSTLFVRNPRIRFVSAMEYDPNSGDVFIADRGLGEIMRLNVSSMIFKTVHRGVNKITSLSIDWQNSNLYWVDNADGSVQMSTAAGKFTRVLELRASCKANQVAVSPNGYIMVACDGDFSKILRCELGGAPCSLVTSDVHFLAGLGFNQRLLANTESSDTVFWASSNSGKIETMNMDGSGRRSSKLRGVAGILPSGNHLYATFAGNFHTIQSSSMEISSSDNLSWQTIKVGDSSRALEQKGSEGHMTVVEVEWRRHYASTSDRKCVDMHCEQICVESKKNAVCLCEQGKKLGQDGKKCISAKCNSQEFKCGDKCVDVARVCDGVQDCDRNEDEQASVCPKCGESDFSCKNGVGCVSKDSVCNWLADCGDGSDELNCGPKECADGFSTCRSGKECYPTPAKCDGRNNCADKSDELDCACEEGHYRCGNFMGACLSNSTICNNVADCVDSSDEQNCPAAKCSATSFACNDLLTCIPLSHQCDGNQDCPAGDDESHPKCLDLGSSHTCAQDEVSCDDTSGECVHFDQLCDGETQCTDGSDEKLCPQSSSVREESTLLQTNIETAHKCELNMFDCGNGDCIPVSQVCDDVENCENGADENLLCRNSCIHNGGCSHQCKATSAGAKCFCRKGYRLLADERSCEDVNECTARTVHPCEHTCINTDGSFACDCDSNYRRGEDYGSCLPVSGQATFSVYTNGSYLQYFGSESITPGTPRSGVYPSELNFTLLASGDDVLVAVDNSTVGLIIARDLQWVPMFKGLGNITAIDADRLNVYLGRNSFGGETFSENGAITVCSVGTSFCSDIFSRDNSRISALVASTREGAILACVELRNEAKIMLMNKDGENSRSLVRTKIKSCSPLALDERKSLVYWFDSGAKAVNVLKISGEAEVTLLPNIGETPISLTVHGLWLHMLLPSGIIQRCHTLRTSFCSPVALQTSTNLVAMTKMDAITPVEYPYFDECEESCSVCVVVKFGRSVCLCSGNADDVMEDDVPCIAPLSYKKDPCNQNVSLSSPCGEGECIPVPPPRDYFCSCPDGGLGASCPSTSARTAEGRDLAVILCLVAAVAACSAAAGYYWYRRRGLMMLKLPFGSKTNVQFVNPLFGATSPSSKGHSLPGDPDACYRQLADSGAADGATGGVDGANTGTVCGRPRADSGNMSGNLLCDSPRRTLL